MKQLLLVPVLALLSSCLQNSAVKGGSTTGTPNNGIQTGVVILPNLKSNEPIRIEVPNLAINEEIVCRNGTLPGASTSTFAVLSQKDATTVEMSIYLSYTQLAMVDVLGSSTTITEVESADLRSYLSSRAKFYINKTKGANGFPATLMYKVGTTWITLENFFCNSTGHSEDQPDPAE